MINDETPIPDFGDIPPESPECDETTETTNVSMCPSGFPPDWDSKIPYHGFSKHVGRREYVVTLSLLRVQTQLGFYPTREKAARAYDAALWKLRPFAPYCATPNFPDQFKDIDDHEVARLCPRAIAVFHRLALKAKESGVEVEHLRARHAVREGLEAAAGDPSSRLAKLILQVEKALQSVLAARFKLMQDTTNFTKLPVLHTKKQEAIASLATAQEALKSLDDALIYNRDYYEKLVKEGIQS